MKKSKVIEIKELTSWYNEKYSNTIYKFDVFFENGEVAQFHTTKEQQARFVVGKEAEYEIEIKELANGAKLKKIKSLKSNNNYIPNKYGYRETEKDYHKRQRYIIAQSCQKSAVQLVGEKDLGEIERVTTTLFGQIMNLVNGCGLSETLDIETEKIEIPA